jgi:hypothetical protein
MIRIQVLGPGLLAATCALAQFKGGGGGGAMRGAPAASAGQPGRGYGYGNVIHPGGAAPGSTYGYGNIIYPGGATAYPGGINNQGYGPPPLGMTGGGRGPGYGGRGGGYGYGGKSRTVVVPYAVPVWTGPGYYYDDYNAYPPDQQASSAITVIVPQQPTPEVIINPGYTPDVARPVLKDYSNAELPEPSPSLRIYDAPTPGRGEEPTTAAPPVERRAQNSAPADDRPTIFLIALKDSSVRAAIGFWSQGNTLNYVTPQGDVNHLSLDMLDRPTTDQLNRERGLDFELKTVY